MSHHKVSKDDAVYHIAGNDDYVLHHDQCHCLTVVDLLCIETFHVASGIAAVVNFPLVSSLKKLLHFALLFITLLSPFAVACQRYRSVRF